MEMLKKLIADEEGAPATEYALLAALVAVAIILGATALGTQINDLFTRIADKLTGVQVN